MQSIAPLSLFLFFDWCSMTFLFLFFFCFVVFLFFFCFVVLLFCFCSFFCVVIFLFVALFISFSFSFSFLFFLLKTNGTIEPFTEKVLTLVRWEVEKNLKRGTQTEEVLLICPTHRNIAVFFFYFLFFYFCFLSK